jgi:hypothetical protein
MMSGMSDRWIILRTGGSRTLALARSLAEAGLDVWTPSAMAERRRGRSRVRVETEAPILPTFVFANADAVQDLLLLESAFTSPHPSFALFRHDGRVAIIGDRELTELRTEEGRAAQAQRKRELARLRTQRRAFTKDQPVIVTEGIFSGLTGRIEQDSSGKFAFVCFGESRWKIATFHLESDDVTEGFGQQAAAA